MIASIFIFKYTIMIKYNHFLLQRRCLHHHRGRRATTSAPEVIGYISAFPGIQLQVFNISIPALWFWSAIWTVAAESTGIFCARPPGISSSPLSATIFPMFLSTTSTLSSASCSHSPLPSAPTPSASAPSLKPSSLGILSPPSPAFPLSTGPVAPPSPSPPVSPS